MAKRRRSSAPDELKTTLRMDRELHRSLRILAIERSTTFAALVEEALREYLVRANEKRGGRR